ncbi:MAG: hypothetical protein WDN45_14830 [Caulobacteraceae bacterium]
MDPARRSRPLPRLPRRHGHPGRDAGALEPVRHRQRHEPGPRAVLMGAAGMNSATLLWYVAAALGLGALALAFPQR